MNDSTTDTMLILAVAKLAGIDPKALAKGMLDPKSTVEYLGQLSAAMIIEATKKENKENKKK